jgi:putative ABC transport system permease protein
MGTVVGVALAFGVVDYFRRSSPIELTVGADVRIDLAVFGFGTILAFLTTLLSGLLPAFRASNVDVMQALKASGRGIFRSRHRVASAVIGVEIAMTFALLIGAGLLISSALRMGSEPLGFNPQNVAATRVSLPMTRYTTGADRRAFFNELLGRLEQSLGDSDVVLASKVPPEAGGNQTLEIQGRPEVGSAAIHDVGADAVSAGFFDLLNIPLRRGRHFDSQDRENSQPVAVVNEALVKEYFPQSDPIGQRIRIPGGPMPWLTVVGVVGNLKHTELMNEMRWVETPILYRPFLQEPRPTMYVALRRTPDSTLTQRIRSEIGGVDPLLPVGDIDTLTSRVSNTLTYARFRAVVLSGFAMTALFLSAVGLHGVLSHFIGQRISEFGLRRAVGAQTSDLLLLVARHGGIPVVAGLVLGFAVSVALSRVLSGLLYGIQSANMEVVIAVSATLLATATIAILLPARRAARIDPIVALKNE